MNHLNPPPREGDPPLPPGRVTLPDRVEPPDRVISLDKVKPPPPPDRVNRGRGSYCLVMYMGGCLVEECCDFVHLFHFTVWVNGYAKQSEARFLFSIKDEVQINITETSASAKGLFPSEVLVKVLQGIIFFSKQLKESSLYFYYTQKFGIKPWLRKASLRQWMGIHWYFKNSKKRGWFEKN